MRYLLFILLLPSLVSAQAYYGGLHTMRSPDLLVLSQDITLNLDQVKVSYLYSNNADHDITETLALTSAPITLTANHSPVHYQIMQHAISANGRDISKELKNLGLPFDPIAAMQVIDASPNRDSIIVKLRTLQLIDKHEDTPTWNLQTYYFWQQIFPAHSKVSIEQIYKPNVSTQNVKLNNLLAALLKLPAKMIKKVWNVAIHWTLSDDSAVTNFQEQFEKYWPRIQLYCPSKKDYQTLVNAYKENHKKANIELKELCFATNNSEPWTTPINSFRLTIEIPKNMHAMLCWNDELKRSNSNTLQYTAENYIPLQNVRVLYVEK